MPTRSPRPPHPEPLGPVAWLLGLELLSSLRGILLDLVQHDFNLRDWMDPGPPVDLRFDRVTGQPRAEIWFDYLADLGDGGRAMSGIAYLLQRDLELGDASGAAPGSEPLALVERGAGTRSLPARLPRGELLFLGGDSAYPTASRIALGARVFAPFEWTRPAHHGPKRALYGLPGNHDYFDDLNGFNQLLRTLVAPDLRHAPETLCGFVQSQQASYVRLRLPGDWELWGLDLAGQGIDFRQAYHFHPPHEPLPTKLIVCTPSPPIVNDAVVADDTHRRSLRRLGLSHDFRALLRSGESSAAGQPACRLDLSGDTHHYARYGAASAGASGIDAHRFAGVVSGGGGAFLHPTTFPGPIHARTKYPEPGISLRVVAQRIVNPLEVLRGGHAWILAGLVALAVFMGARPWVGALTHVVHRLVGAPDVPAAWPRAALVMFGGVATSITLVVLWLLARGRLLGHRPAQRRARTAPPGSDADAPEPGARLKGWLATSYFAALGWTTLQVLLLVASAFVPPWLAATIAPGASLWATLAIFGLALFGVGPVVLALALGAGNLRGARKLWFLPVGVLHGLMQVTLPLFLVVYASLRGLALVVALAAVLAAVARLVTRTPRLQAAARYVVPLLWIAQWVGAVLLLGACAGRLHLQPGWATVPGAVLAGVLVASHQLGWYFLVAMLWRGHVNEAGAAARLEGYKQWIRFHIADGVLTGYVIGVDEAVDASRQAPRARLVDVFQMKA